jgi:prepilin-type processing-associated H-X9-DG protein
MSRIKGNRRDTAEKVHLTSEVATAGRDELMEAMIGACAMIAYADGHVDPRERRRVLKLMRSIPAFTGFSGEIVAEEFDRHQRAFEYEPSLAREKVLDNIKALKPHVSSVRMLLFACQNVLEADGIYHPQEYQALKEVSEALRAA